MRFDKVMQNAFVFTLFDEKEKWVRAHSFSNVFEIDLATHFSAFDHPCAFCQRSLLNKTVRKPDLLINLKRPRLYADRL